MQNLIAKIDEIAKDYSHESEKTRMYNGIHIANLIYDIKQLVVAEQERIIKEFEQINNDGGGYIEIPLDRALQVVKGES